MKCRLSNFKKEANLMDLQIPDVIKTKSGDKLLKDLSIDEVIKVLKKTTLKGVPFSVSLDTSEDVLGYEDSIKELNKAILQTLAKKELSFKLTLDNINKIKDELNRELYPTPLTVNDKEILAVIPEVGLITEEARRKLDLDDTLSVIFEGDNVFDRTREDLFNSEMMINSIINVNSDYNFGIVDSVQSLNENIMAYQEKQYSILRDFLVNAKLANEKHFNESSMSQTIYDKDPNTTERSINSGYYNTMQIMYNYIMKLKEDGVLNNILEDSWSSVVTKSKGDSSFYNAVCAYINLAYFDKIIKNCFGDYISIDSRFDIPINTNVSSEGEITTEYKYKFTTGNSNNVKVWDQEEDALEKMSNFSQFLIKSIPVYEYQSKQLFTGKLDPKSFINTITRLITYGQLVPDTDENFEFIIACRDFYSNMEGNLNIIFKYLFQNENNKSLIENLNKNGFDINNLDYLYSIYRTVFDGENSWFGREQAYIKEYGYTSRYSIVDTLLGVMKSNVAMNYMETTYDADTKQLETKVKSKIIINKSKFGFIKSVNRVVAERGDKATYLDVYNINQKDSIYTITINRENSPLTFVIEQTTSKARGLLDKKERTNDFSLKGIPNINSLNLGSKEERERLIRRENLSDSEKDIVAVLDFVDDMLGTYFGKTSDGLRELNLTLKINNTNFKDIVISAARALLVTDIYDKFEKATKEDGSKYSKNELSLFLKEHSDVYDYKINEIDDYAQRRYFFEMTDDGEQLTTLKGTQAWISDYAKAKAQLAGDSNKSTINNFEGSKIPNYSPTFLGATAKQQFHRSKINRDASSFLLFNNDERAIITEGENTEIKLEGGNSKSVKDMSLSELSTDAILSKFIVPFLAKGAIWVQPTTYSDKTKFTQYLIDLSSLGLDKIESDSFNSVIEQKIMDSIGRSYKAVYDNIINDYKRLFPEYVNGNEINMNQVQNWMKTHTKYDLLKRGIEKGVDVYEEIHYREIKGGHLSTNELIFEYNDIYNNRNKLSESLNFEKVKFINGLSKNRVRFFVDFDISGKLSTTDQVSRMLSKFKEPEKWIQGGMLIHAKVTKADGTVQNIIYQNVKLEPGDTIELDPILDRYFMLDTFLGNNLRLGLTGSEINHPIKFYKKLNLNSITSECQDFIKKFNPDFNPEVTTFYDIRVALNNYDGNVDFKEQYDKLKNIYNEHLYILENASQGAQFKRNVIIPGTIRPYLNDRLNGISDKMKIAVIEDVRDDVFNFDGKTSKEKAHDGSAFINPFTSILENWSLQDNEVGTVKKPIHHWFDDKYMTATLLKYAVDTMTNQWMRQAEGNDINENQHAIVIRNMFKKMTNMRWHNPDGTWAFGPIDLIDGCEYRNDNHIDFFNDILEGTPLYYRDGIDHYQIKDFQLDDDVYCTIESKVDDYGNPTGEFTYYHYFNENGEHLKTTEKIEDAESKGYHTIDSLFELHTALGGIYSESKKNGTLQYSESSNYAVARFINKVATLKEDGDANDLTQKSYYQPLKQAMIDMVANQTAVKNGTGNINSTSSFYDNSKLNFIIVGTDNYGIQMDADHTADEAKMTEFSQVISSLDAKGRLHDYVHGIYEVLGQVALETSKVELQAVEEFRKSGNISKIYDVVGRTIINNISSKKGQAGLADAIIKAIRKEMDKFADHSLDDLKIPFSDPSIYSSIMSTFVSTINKKSIKRKYNGTGAVMVPGYNMSMIYDIDGQTYQFEDLIKKAYAAGYTSTSTDISKKNREVVKQYLEAKQNEIPIEDNSIRIMPTDNVILHINGERFQIDKLNKELVNYNLERYGTRDSVVLKLNINDQFSVRVIKEEDLGSFSVNINLSEDPLTQIELDTLKESLLNLIPEGSNVTLNGNLSNETLDILKYVFSSNDGSNIVGQKPMKDIGDSDVNVPIYRIGDTYESNHKEYVSLYDINDYYLFKDDPKKFLKKRGYTNITNIGYQKDITSSRNLAPAKISWEYEDENGVRHFMNIFDTKPVKDAFYGKRDQSKIQEVFDYLEKGIYYDGVNKYKIVEGTLQNQAAELIMSNIYMTKFGIKDGDSLADIVEQKEKYFKKDIPEPVISDNYDLVYLKNNGQHLYITFKPLQKNNKDFQTYAQDWKYINYDDFTYEDKIDENGNKVPYSGEKTIRHRVYATTKDNVRLFEIGRQIVNDDVEYDEENKVFRDKNTKELVKHQDNYSVDVDGKVIEFVQFLFKREVNETRGKKRTKFNLYNINRDALYRVLRKPKYTERDLTRIDKDGKVIKMTEDQKFEYEINSFIGKILSKIYESEDFNGIKVNGTISEKSALTIQNSLLTFANRVSYDKELNEHLLRLQTIVAKGKQENGNRIVNSKKVNTLFSMYLDSIAKKKYISFLKSLDFVAARIPAQTLQSFMKMKCVGFTGLSTNQCFVSHWQTWLQGSKNNNN